MKIIKYFKKGSGICGMVVCGLVASIAVVLVAHNLVRSVVGPAVLGFSLKRLKKKLMNYKLIVRGRNLKKVWEQLDVAAKVAYILNKDFKTMSRLIERVYNEVEHNGAMIRLCLERGDSGRFCVQVVEEIIKKSNIVDSANK